MNAIVFWVTFSTFRCHILVLGWFWRVSISSAFRCEAWSGRGSWWKWEFRFFRHRHFDEITFTDLFISSFDLSLFNKTLRCIKKWRTVQFRLFSQDKASLLKTCDERNRSSEWRLILPKRSEWRIAYQTNLRRVRT